MANVFGSIETTKETWLYEIVKQENVEGIAKVDSYMIGLGSRDMSEEEQQNVALLMLKCLPCKAEFAQTLNSFLSDKIDENCEIKFTIPQYIKDAITFLIP